MIPGGLSAYQHAYMFLGFLESCSVSDLEFEWEECSLSVTAQLLKAIFYQQSFLILDHQKP